jgi:metal-dependent amidase/aminoacylase/carboxypeptidase family protein
MTSADVATTSPPRWRDRRIGTGIAVGVPVLYGVTAGWLTPRGPITAAEALTAVVVSLVVGGVAGQAIIVLHAAFPFNGEDFALFLQRTPGAMLYLGVANPDAGINGLPHAPGFAADERAIGVGVRAMTGLLSNRLRVLRQ